MVDWNPNWVAYAVSQGTTPERLPDGPSTNAAFIAWMGEQAAAFAACTGIAKDTHPGTFADELADWLTDAYPVEPDPDPDPHQLWGMAHPVLPEPFYDGGRLVRVR